MLVLNIPIFAIGVVFLGQGFGLRSLYGTILFSFLTDATSALPSVTENVILASIFGGALLGIGLGIVFLMGASSGGTDILAALGHKLISAIDVGKWVFIIDSIIILVGAYFFKNTELVLAGILALFVNSFLVDYVISGANMAKVVYVISEKSDAIAKEIIKKIERGVTGIYCRGMYENEEKVMLMCVIKRFELQKLEKIVNETDERAFLIYAQARRISGNGFKIYPIN